MHSPKRRALARIVDTRASAGGNTLAFTVQQVEGVDVYGSFMIGLAVLDAAGEVVLELHGTALSRFPQENIHNAYVAKVKPGAHSLVLPLGAKAELQVMDEAFSGLAQGEYRLLLTDISGATWSAKLQR